MTSAPWIQGVPLALLFGVQACTPPFEPPAALDEVWSTHFADRRPGSLVATDSTWVPIFGELVLDDSVGLRATPGDEHGGDDYAYHRHRSSGVTIVQQWYWDTDDAVGAETVVAESGALYELTLYQDRLQIMRYDGGGDPSVYEILEMTKPLGLSNGDFEIVFHSYLHDGAWTLFGELRSATGETLATVGPQRDRTHGASIGQGVGIWNQSSERSYLRSMTVYEPGEVPGG